MKPSPLFWPIKFKDNVIYILDETLLPEKVKYIPARNYRQACKAIKEMKTRAVGQVILVFYIFLLVLRQNKKQKNLLPVLEEVSRAVNATRPTLSFKFLTEMLLNWVRSGAPLEEGILGFLEGLKNSRLKQAQVTSQLLNDGDVILTHCNVSGLMPLIAEFAKRQGKSVSFFVTETRPYLQGWRLTAWELKRQGFDVTLIADSMAAQVMSEKKISKVIVGSDNLAQNGDIANKIGTLQLAVLARHFNIPFYVLCPPPSDARTGAEIKIEVRPDRELLEYGGKRLAPKAAKGYYPAFDITPNELITKHIYLEMER